MPATRLPGEEGQAAPVSVLLGSMERHPGIQSLADSGAIKLDDLAPGEGLVRSLPVRGDPRLVATGIDDAGRARAAQSLAVDFPRLRGTDGPTFGDVEEELWAFLSGYSPAGQAAIGLYKLDRLLEEAREDGATGVHILMSVEKADSLLGEYVRAFAQARLPLAEVTVEIDDRDVTRAKTTFDDAFDVPSEVGRFREALRAEVLPRVSRGARVDLRARLSEPPEVRARLAEEAKQELLRAGADAASTVEILSAFKQGFSWLRESVLPELKSLRDSLALQEVAIRFLENKPPAEWPQQAMHTPVRWLHEIFPVDEILAAELDLDLDRIRLEMVEEGPVYEIESFGPQGETVLRESFEPKWVLRPYFDRFRDYEQVRVTTGWVTAVSGGDTLYDGRIKTDPEWFWDRFQEKTLPAVYDYVMDRHDGRPRGGPVDAPFFGELTVDLALSEPDYRLGIENEIVSTMDALHEEIYFGTIEFFHLIGRHSRGDDLVYPGRIIPRMRPKADGEDGQGRIRLTGFATSRPAVVLRQRGRDGATSSKRLDIPKTRIERPASHRAVLAASGSSGPSVRALSIRVRVDEELDRREELLKLAPARTVDATISSAEQTEAVIRELEGLRDAGLYAGALAYEDLGDLELWVEWSHDLDSESRRTVRLSAGGKPIPPLRLPALTAEAAPRGERIVQWETPIPPDEGNRMLALMDASSDYATSYLIGRSYLGRPIWAMDLMSPISASHWSRAKASTFKPTVIYSARQHANEVSSTSHVLRHAELLLADSAGRARLDRVNVVIHPFTNPDGAQLAYDLYRETPDYILHAAYLASLGMDATSGSSSDFPIYPESTVRPRLWDLWLPDIFLDPHGYPSHQVVQLFSEYSGLVRRGRVTERNWGMNKGWFMPGFAYIDDPDFPRHKDAALKIRDYITRGINSNRDVFEMNQRNYARYLRYGAAHDPEVYRLPLIDSVLIEMPLKGSSGAGARHNPEITIWRGITEAPDETAYGPWMELMAKAGLSWDQAILDYLYDGDHEVERSGSSFFGGVTLKMHRPRPPKDPAEESAQQSGARE